MLLDDVLSELDPEHRGLLLERLSGSGQTVITATEPEAVPDGVAWASLAVDAGTVSPVPALREVA
jgi:recombinational DNA repair ATPase RecF